VQTLHFLDTRRLFQFYIISHFIAFLLSNHEGYAVSTDLNIHDSLYYSYQPLKITMMADFQSLLNDRG
jgi:hypothetical protein